VKFVHDTSVQRVFIERSTHMLQHGRHEYTRATSLAFPYMADMFELTLLVTAECQVRRGKFVWFNDPSL